MANTVRLKRSSVASKIPTTADLQLGELAINTFDGKLFLKKDNGTASIVEIGAGSSGSGDVVGPASATDNAVTRFDGTTGKLIQNSSVTIDDSGNMTFTATGERIRGDFSNATVANRVMFQNNVTNGATNIHAIPNGTSTTSGFVALNNSDPTNSAYTYLSVISTESRIISSVFGTGTYLPMTFYTGGSERMRIDTAGNVLVTNAAGLGYGTGAGGTVTQPTSKTTSVTLNKPTGQVITSNASLAANASVTFVVSNSLLASQDLVLLTPSNTSNYAAECINSTNGAFRVRLTNLTAGALSDAVTINFAIIKGATA